MVKRRSGAVPLQPHDCSSPGNVMRAQAISSFGPLAEWQDAQGQPSAMLAAATPGPSPVSAPQTTSQATIQHPASQNPPPFHAGQMLPPVTRMETAALSLQPSTLPPCPVPQQLPTPGGQMLPPPALQVTKPLSSRPPAQSIESPSGSFLGREEAGQVSGRAGHHQPPCTNLASECLVSGMHVCLSPLCK